MSHQTVDLIIYAKWILPIVPRNKIFENCALIVDKGKIVAIKPATETEKSFIAKSEQRLDNHILMPGLVNSHGHAAMTLLRGYADDLPLQTWLEEHIWPAEAQHMSDQFVRQGVELAMAEMIRSGTTCFSDMYFFPDETAKAALEAGMRCQVAFPILEFQSAWAKDADEYLDKGLSLRDDYRSNELINVIFGPHAPYTVSNETFSRIARLAPEIQSSIHVHLHETAFEISSAEAEHKQRPIQRLHELGVLTPATQCVHMTQVNETDLQLLQETGAHVIHCPESNLKLASGFCPVKTLMDAGVNVALGTDGTASNNNLDMFGEMHTAALLAKAVANDASALDATETLEMATINGAKSMGLDTITGSLEIGKSADMIALELDPIDQAPLHNLSSMLVYTHNGHRVTHNWVNGKALMIDRKLITLNERDIIANASEWHSILKATSKA